MPNRTHAKIQKSFKGILESLRDHIIKRGDLEHVSVQQQLDIISKLSEFPLGRFILEYRGADGYWTDYMISHPRKGKISGLNSEGKPFNFVEDFFLNRCPVVVAHQERFTIFQKLIQENLKEGSILASIPCGLMRDLLDLDFSKVKDFKLIGIDIDEKSLALASNIAKEKRISNVEFIQQDAWRINFHEKIDLITSSGLNVYEPDLTKIIDLYRKFFSSLKKGGILITSLLTHPPGEEIATDWDLKGIDEKDLLMDRIIHKDILDIKWRNFRSLNNLTDEFEKAGFSNISVHLDKHRIFPTICAKKP